MYSTEKPIASRQHAYRIARCNETHLVKECDSVIDEFFVENERGITQKRVKEEICFATNRAKVARDNGLRGGRPKTQSKPSGLAKPNPEKSSPDSRLHTPEEPNSKPTPIVFEVIDPPIWVPTDSWQAYLELRRAKKAKITAKAALMIFKKLREWMEKGQDPGAVLEQSVMNGWTGIFELSIAKEKKNVRGPLECDEAIEKSLRNFGFRGDTKPH